MSDLAAQAARLEAIYSQLMREYPEKLQGYLSSNKGRFLWQAGEALRLTPDNAVVLDIGAGLSPFAAICAKLGMRVTIVDDFQDPMYDAGNRMVLELFQQFGVTIISGNAFEVEWSNASEQFDLVASMDSMEHWHQSPKALFRRIVELMKPRAVFWLGVPNCVNLRKRLTVPFGFGKWSSMGDWYESPVFRGHVREPDVDDLDYIARDLDFREYSIKGMNWLGYRNRNALVRGLVPFVDWALRLRPSLCSDIYLYGVK